MQSITKIMDAVKLKNAGVDYDRGVKRFMGRFQLYEKALTRFLKDTTFSRILSAYEAGDNEEFYANVHEFKGMCGNIALTSLYEQADGIVRLIRSGEYSPRELSEKYEAMASDYSTVYTAVAAEVGDTK